MGEDMITTDEAAQELGVKRVTVLSYIYRHLLKSVKRGPMHFLDAKEVAAFKTTHTSKPGPRPGATKQK